MSTFNKEQQPMSRLRTVNQENQADEGKQQPLKKAKENNNNK